MGAQRGDFWGEGLLFGGGGGIVWGTPPTPHPVPFAVVKEIGPIWVRLHKAELEELPQAQPQEVGADLGGGGIKKKRGVREQWGGQ